MPVSWLTPLCGACGPTLAGKEYGLRPRGPGVPAVHQFPDRLFALLGGRRARDLVADGERTGEAEVGAVEADGLGQAAFLIPMSSRKRVCRMVLFLVKVTR